MIYHKKNEIIDWRYNGNQIHRAYNNDEVIFGKEPSSANYTLIDYVYCDLNYPAQITVNQVVDKTTAMQFKYYNIRNNGQDYVGSVGNSDANYNFRIFGLSTNALYLDAFGTRNNVGGVNATGNTYEREFGWDVDLNRKYVRNYSGERTELFGSSTYILTGTSSSSFSQSGNLIFFNSNDLFRLYYFKVYKNKVLINDFRPAKFNDGTYGIVDIKTETPYKDTSGNLKGSE